jgi:hypothetical protein
MLQTLETVHSRALHQPQYSRTSQSLYFLLSLCWSMNERAQRRTVLNDLTITRLCCESCSDRLHSSPLTSSAFLCGQHHMLSTNMTGNRQLSVTTLSGGAHITGSTKHSATDMLSCTDTYIVCRLDTSVVQVKAWHPRMQLITGQNTWPHCHQEMSTRL